MLLYHCRTCGRWQDVSLLKSMNDAFTNVARLMNQEPPEQLGYPCPAGHGLMVHVQATERIYVRSGVVETMVEDGFKKREEQRKAIDEIAQLSQDLGMYE